MTEENFLSENGYEYVIGLEIHAQICSNSKLFSGAPTNFGNLPNQNVTLFDAAIPGTLPSLNKFCVEQAIKSGLALNAKINNISMFDRKHYFYPDLPNGYQISQFYFPIVENGYIYINANSSEKKKIRINRIHLEQDAGKSIHDNENNQSRIDLNRAGVGLMEIVTEPDIRSPEEAAQCLKQIRLILQYIGACDGNMENGSLRCDANISIRKIGEDLGVRTEIKNLNSVNNMVKALKFEALRHFELINANKKLTSQTRLFNPTTSETKLMREKEEIEDYRYFQDFDLLPIKIEQNVIEEIREKLTELPEERKKRYIQDLNLPESDAELLISEIELSNFFEECISNSTVEAKIFSNWIITEIFSKLNKFSLKISESLITPSNLVRMLELIKNGTISGKLAKQVFEIMFDTGKDPEKIVEEKNLRQISDTQTIENIINEILASMPDKIEEYKKGKTKLFGFFVGQVMKKISGKANPELLNKILRDKLDTS